MSNKSLDKLSNNELRVLLYENNLKPYLDDEGKLLREIAIRELQKANALRDQAEPVIKGRRVKVIFHKTGADASAPYVYAALNDYDFACPYEEEVIIPEKVLREVIDRAVKTDVIMKEKRGEDGQPLYEEHRVHTHPYTFLGYVEEEA